MQKRVILGCLTMATALSAFAQPTPRPYLGSFQRATPDFVAPVEMRGGQLVVTGPKRPYVQTPVGLAPRQVVFDSEDVDLFGVDSFGHKYGVDGAVVQFPEDFPAFAWVNDMYASPATQGRVSYDWGCNFLWNPDGTSPIGGTANMVLLLLVGDQYFDSGFPFSSAGGWGLFFENFNSGYWGVGVSGLPLSMPWTTPGRPACQLLQLATYDTNFNILPSTGAGQFMQFQMLSPTEPNPEYVGTNQSDSTSSCWIDTNNDFNWDGSESYTLENTFPIGRTQPMTALMVNSGDPVFEGRIEFDGVPSTPRPIRAIRIQTRNPGESPFLGGSILREEYIFLGPNGEFRATAPSTPGTYDISFQGEHFLRKTVGPIAVSGPGSIDVGTITLTNGNADHTEYPDSPSTSVDIVDYAVFSLHYGLSWPYPSYDAETCDLNRDDAIDIADYAILSANYGFEGDD